MPPKLNRRRAETVLTRIDAILAWEARHENERDTRFVELGKCLCEVRAGQFWRLENLKSFDDFLERRFPGSRRKAYYLMSIHEQLPPQARKGLKEMGRAKGIELTKLARKQGEHFESATWLIYIRFAPQDFLTQFGGQLARKAARHNLQDSFASFFFYLIGQYANDGGHIVDIFWVLPLWVIGLAGLGDAARIVARGDSLRRRSLYLIYGAQILIIALTLWSAQIWYIIHVIPITAIGVVHFLNNGRSLSVSSRFWGMALALPVLFCVAGFVE